VLVEEHNNKLIHAAENMAEPLPSKEISLQQPFGKSQLAGAATAQDMDTILASFSFFERSDTGRVASITWQPQLASIEKAFNAK